jgi:hypothetical protein
MPQVPRELERFDVRLTAWLARHGLTFLRISLGLVYLSGSGSSSSFRCQSGRIAAARTIERLSGGLVGPGPALGILAVWESLIGSACCSGFFSGPSSYSWLYKCWERFTPLVMFPSEVFHHCPLCPDARGTVHHQERSAHQRPAMVLGATVRGGGLVAHPEAIEVAEQLDDEEAADVR